MGLRKRPYNDDKKGGKGDSKKSVRTPKSSADGKGEFKSGGEKRPYKKAEGFDRKPARSQSDSNERRTPAKRAGGYKRNDDGPSRFSGEGSERRTPAKRTGGGYKRSDEGSERKPSRFSGEGGERRTPAKRIGSGFKRSDEGADRRPGRFSGEGSERRTPAKRAGGFKREEGERGPKRFGNDDRKPSGNRSGGFNRTDEGSDRRPGRFSDEGGERRTPAKRTGGYNREGGDRDRAPKRFGNDDRKPASRSGFNKRDEGVADESFEQKPRTSRSGKPYMVRGAKARDIKAKSDEMLETLIPGEIRLNRYISNAGICSRREADDLIAAGLVAVNGTIVTEMGHKVQPGDEVRYNNERLSWEKKVYLIMNKPKDSITSSDDPEGRKIIMDLIKDPRLPRVYPVGRLDRNTTGVILLTNDGELAQRLTHPKYNITKVYKATLNKSFAAKDLQELGNNGVDLEDGPIKPDVIGIPSASEKDVVMVQIHSGRNRIIHRMFEAMGYLVDKLDRIDFAGLERKGLDRAEWRHLDDKEIKKLKKLVQLK